MRRRGAPSWICGPPVRTAIYPQALAALADSGCDDASLTVQFSYVPEANFPLLPARALEEGMYRIAQEALANACRRPRRDMLT